jgi:hypothetical protein
MMARVTLSNSTHPPSTRIKSYEYSHVVSVIFQSSMSHMNNLQNKAPRPQFFKKILSRVGEARKKLCMYAVH